MHLTLSIDEPSHKTLKAYSYKVSYKFDHVTFKTKSATKPHPKSSTATGKAAAVVPKKVSSVPKSTSVSGSRADSGSSKPKLKGARSAKTSQSPRPKITEVRGKAVQCLLRNFQSR